MRIITVPANQPDVIRERRTGGSYPPARRRLINQIMIMPGARYR